MSTGTVKVSILLDDVSWENPLTITIGEYDKPTVLSVVDAIKTARSDDDDQDQEEEEG